MQEKSLRFQVQLLEDTHTGSGEGRLGMVDDTQTQDRYGRPVIRHTTWQGLLREAAEDWLISRRAAGLETGQEQDLLAALLGRIGDTTGSATICSLRSKFVPDDSIRGFWLWTTTAREAFGRSPDDKTLRTIESAAAGITLEGEIRLRDDGTAGEVAMQLLERCLKRITAAGGSKSRGGGRIRVLPDSIDPRSLPVDSAAVKQVVSAIPAAPADAPVVLRLLLKNLEPLNLTATGSPTNIMTTQTYLPGGRLRGALLTWLSDRDPSLADSLSSAKAMQVSNAYVVPDSVVKNGWQHTLVCPIPLSVRQPKSGIPADGKPESVDLNGKPWWASGGSHRFGGRSEWDDIKKKKEDVEDERVKSEDYLVPSPDGKFWQRLSPEVAVHMRNQVPTLRRDPDQLARAGRPDALFSEEVLVEEQHFLADVVFGTRSDAERFARLAVPLLSGAAEDRSWLLVGRGRRPVQVEAYAWSKTKGKAPYPVDQQPNSLTVVLASDWIVRTPWLTFVTEVTLSDLKRVLLQAISDDSIILSGDGIALRSEAEPAEIYGYNNATGLPRAPAVAIRRGSVLRLDLQEGADPEILQAWRSAFQLLAARGRGVGERTEEGFGRFLLDPDWKLDGKDNGQSADSPQAKSNWHEAVLAEVEACLSEILVLEGKRDAEKRLSTSQWQWLRQQAKGRDIAIFLDELKRETRASRDEWKVLLQLLDERVNGLVSAVRIRIAPNRLGRYFLDQLAQAAIYELRAKSKQMGDERD